VNCRALFALQYTVYGKVCENTDFPIQMCFYRRPYTAGEIMPGVSALDTTNICNSAQKENVKLGWAKHIPNFTENG
jgi:hypothetical protein